jgi:DNA polymerase-3 subunit delta
MRCAAPRALPVSSERQVFTVSGAHFDWSGDRRRSRWPVRDRRSSRSAFQGKPGKDGSAALQAYCEILRKTC